MSVTQYHPTCKCIHNRLESLLKVAKSNIRNEHDIHSMDLRHCHKHCISSILYIIHNVQLYSNDLKGLYKYDNKIAFLMIARTATAMWMSVG